MDAPSEAYKEEMGGHWFDNLARRSVRGEVQPRESDLVPSSRPTLAKPTTSDPLDPHDEPPVSRRGMLTRVGLTTAAIGAFVLPGWSGALAACGSGRTRCFGKCVNRKRNKNHCGACGNRCLSSQYCSKGKCCKVGLTNCRGSCVNLKTNEVNCGACGNDCAANKFCSKGKCCPEGSVNCGGTCVNLKTSEANCGACGNDCAAGETCVQGVCQESENCPSGETFCNGSCVDTNTDEANCGECNAPCQPTVACSDAVCTDGVCNQVLNDSACGDNNDARRTCAIRTSDASTTPSPMEAHAGAGMSVTTASVPTLYTRGGGELRHRVVGCVL